MEGGNIFIDQFLQLEKSNIVSGTQMFYFHSRKLMKNVFPTTLPCLCPNISQNSSGTVS